MANQGPDSRYNAAQIPGQAQMRRENMADQPSDIHSQGQQTNILQDTGTQVKNMAQGAADIGKGAAQGAVNIARGAALGAANMAQGAADAVKNTLGMNNTSADNTNPNNPTNTNHPGNPTNTNYPGNVTYPGHNPSNPSTRI